tara:strand:- start:76 stop:930 length:855 start_codon:yes stop_codon:yes gene_type:complete
VDPPNTFKLRQFVDDEYRINGGSGFTLTEGEWAKEQMQKAHDSYVLHRSSRRGYGSIMLMTDTASSVASKATSSSAAAAHSSQGRTRENLKFLTDVEGRPKDAPLTERLKEEVDTFHKQQARILRGERDKSLEISKNTTNEDTLAIQEKNRLFLTEAARLSVEIQDGFRAAMSIIVNQMVFTDHASGGWIAFFAWFKASEKEWADTSPNEPFKNSARGKELCRIYADKATELVGRRDKGTQFWKAVCQFMHFLSNRTDLNSKGPFFTDEELRAVIDVPTWDDII